MSAMVNLSYEELIEQDEVFGSAVRHWDELAREIAADVGQTGEWERWRGRRWGNGTPMQEEYQWNPIFDRRSRRLDRAFSIIQWPPSEVIEPFSGGPGVAGWLKSYQDFEGDVPKRELVLSVATVTDVTTHLIRELITEWMTPDTSVDTMQRRMDEINAAR